VNSSKSNGLDKLLVLPAIIIVAIITQVPFIFTVGLSVIRWNVKRPDMGISFNGLDNFIAILTDSNFYQVVIHTLILTGVSLLICTILGLALALLYNREFKGISILRAFILLPYFVTGSVVGIIWKTLMLDPSFGFNYYIAKLFGIKPLDFLGHFSLVTIIFLVVWQQAPFFYLLLRAGLQNLSESVVESAKIDGAHGWKMLVHIKIPSIKGHLVFALMLGLINILKVFDLIYVTTQGGPGIASSNLPYYSYRSAFYDWDIGQSSTVAIFTVIIILLVIQNFNKVFRKSSEKVGE
jgi:sorbitol/mannitol transport system permease protein